MPRALFGLIIELELKKSVVKSISTAHPHLHIQTLKAGRKN
jgi:hypothetical protein